ncbi:hypothetical protein HO133_001327 [Letharia lupina]|uniref:Peptidase A1 domain-containing protein n=1 Tax=Letharia lupina TaxID=560253 RepID=A0A8H6CFH3_9LECA|nr:uncharacterized protein HO133_001327 [Letharia lupina]KAF6222241.1 hypothetical protein HO133_001327 [Letharia lupina]
MRLSQWQTSLLLCLASLLPRPLFAASSAATSLPTCTPQNSIPIHYPIRNVTLSDSTLRRGAAVSFGTPGQPFACLINPTYNNTYLNDGTVPRCSVNNTRSQCSNQYGGLFDEGSSTTWSPSNFAALGTAGESTSDQDNDTWGSDTLLVNTTLSVPDFPLGIFRGSRDYQNTLGLGRNSTLLNALVSAEAIASRTFSIFQGWTGAQTQYQTDGSLILGGYDSAKITGKNITLPLTVEEDCINGLLISVTDINMNLNNGSNISIIGKSRGSAMRACIEPDYSPMTLSEDIWWAFTNVTGVAETGRSVSPINLWGMMIPTNGAYDGDLTFSIYPDLDITIPNHQLIVPDIEINSEGQGYPSSSTEVEVLINSLQGSNTNDMPLFGMPFLSSAYLMVDNDRRQFTLSQSQQSTTSNLVAIGPPACNTPAPSHTPQPLPSILASPTPTPKSSSGTPKGAIAGAVVGGLAIIAICIGVFFVQKKRRAQRLAGIQKQEYGAVAEAVKNPEYSDNQVCTTSEMSSHRQPPQEMPLDRDSRKGIAPHELPATSRLRRPGSAI